MRKNKWLAFAAACMAALSLAGGALAESAVGSAAGFGGEVTVTLTAEDGKITEAVVTGENETPAVGGQAVLKLQEAMIAAGSIEVDSVAGATITSEAVKAAAQSAWNELTGAAADVQLKMQPGTYVGSAKGFRTAWPVEVSVTVDESRILAIEVADSADTVGIFQSAVDLLVPRMLEYQSVAVDSISGATVSSNAIKSAVKNALSEALLAGGSSAEAIAAFQRAPEKSKAVETLTTDVLVVGLGAAGTTAALGAAETLYAADPENVQVLALDKAGRYGGASSLCAGVFALNPPKLSERYNEGKPFADRDALLADWLAYTEGDAKTEMVELLLDHSGETLDWLVDDYGMELEQPTGGLTEGDANVVLFSYAPAAQGMTIRRQHNIKFYENCMTRFTEMGGRYMLETEAYDLLRDESGAVAGVRARNTADGTEYEIHAKKVILATGGFAANADMEEQYLSDEYYPLKGVWSIVGMLQNDGVMIQSALDNGAASYNIGMCPAVHIIGTSGYLSQFETHDLDKYCAQTNRTTRWTEGDLPHYLGVAKDNLVVNTKGERFTNEENTNFNAWKSGPDYYVIYSEAQIADVVKNGLRTAPAYMMTVNLGACGWAPEGTPIPNAFEVMEAAVEAGIVTQGDSLADVAAQLGMDADVLTATVARYNAMCASGEDTDFSKKPEFLDPIAEGGKYYAIHMKNYCYSTCAALDVDAELRVLQTDGAVLEGLYAAGLDCSGVLYSEKKPYVTYGGVDQGFAFTSGRLAGTNAANAVLAR